MTNMRDAADTDIGRFNAAVVLLTLDTRWYLFSESSRGLTSMRVSVWPRYQTLTERTAPL